MYIIHTAGFQLLNERQSHTLHTRLIATALAWCADHFSFCTISLHSFRFAAFQFTVVQFKPILPWFFVPWKSPLPHSIRANWTFAVLQSHWQLHHAPCTSWWKKNLLVIILIFWVTEFSFQSFYIVTVLLLPHTSSDHKSLGKNLVMVAPGLIFYWKATLI